MLTVLYYWQKMEDLINAFALYEVTPQFNSTAREHPRFSQYYKVKPSASSQEERRRRFLEAQKLKRYDYGAHARGLATNHWKKEQKTVKVSEEMDVSEEFVKPTRSYKNQLMLSEWLVEVPNDLASEWLLVPCPVGKRCLVVSSRGITKVYTKSGYTINTFYSKLPGGGRAVAGDRQHSYCLLDCVYSEEERTFYILDIMCWNSHPLFDSDTDFRFYWRESKIKEHPEIQEVNKHNQYKFLPLTHFSCEKEAIQDAVCSSFCFDTKLDGLLFYHRKAHYVCGTTPLVGWLKGYMLPEMLKIEIPNELAKERPASYVSMQQHVPEAFRNHEIRKQQEESQMQYEEENT